MKVKELIEILRKLSPESNAESFDNVGLLTGSFDDEIKGILVTLDCLEEVVEEAVRTDFNMIITFHPIIFSGLKSITGKNYVERTIIKAIQNKINIYAIHTNLDAAKGGVNDRICNILGVKSIRPLIPFQKKIKKLQTYVPVKFYKQVQQSLFQAGAGEIENYKNCSFRMEGKGTFLPQTGSNPRIGEIGYLESVEEVLISMIFEDYKELQIIQALKKSHPYEEVAYEITLLENENQEIGMGKIGYLEKSKGEIEFIQFVKKNFQVPCIRHSRLLNKEIRKVAVCGGSGSFAISQAIAQEADVFITADIKYHDFFKAESKILLMDIGHYESEQFTKNLLVEYLNRFVTIPLEEYKKSTNPVFYF